MDIGKLIMALNRLKIPNIFQNLIIALFTGRSNAIIITDHISESYSVLQGIDQGEVISPLLWLIYHDPLYQLLEQMSNGYTTTATFYKHLHNPSHDLILKEKHTITGYLDDTVIFNESQNDLEIALHWINIFYRFMNIYINYRKLLIATTAK